MLCVAARLTLANTGTIPVYCALAVALSGVHLHLQSGVVGPKHGSLVGASVQLGLRRKRPHARSCATAQLHVAAVLSGWLLQLA